MKAFLQANWKPIAHTIVGVGCYVLYRFFPQLAPERDLLITIALAWGVLGTGFVPGFMRVAGAPVALDQPSSEQ